MCELFENSIQYYKTGIPLNVNSLHTLDLFLHVIHFSKIIFHFLEATNQHRKPSEKYKKKLSRSCIQIERHCAVLE